MNLLLRAPLACGADTLRRTMSHRVILLHPSAPPKPAEGQHCNGCGVCCTAQPCPLGMLLSRKRQGLCVALQWDGAGQLYRCGVVASPRRWLPWLPTTLGRHVAHRWIAAARGCDSDFEASEVSQHDVASHQATAR